MAVLRVRPVRVNTTVASLFMVGSACFALGTVPAYASAVGTGADLVTFVVGSVLYARVVRPAVQAQSPDLAPTPRRDGHAGSRRCSGRGCPTTGTGSQP